MSAPWSAAARRKNCGPRWPLGSVITMPKRQPPAAHGKRKAKLNHETTATPMIHRGGHGAEREHNGVNLLPATSEPLEALRRLGREVQSMEKAKKDGFVPMGNMSEMNASFQKNAKR